MLLVSSSTIGGQLFLEVASAAGGVSFWLTVVLAAAGSGLSAMCLADPVSHPKDQPCAFLGQWFIWLATALLWATVGVSLAWSWVRPADLIAAAIAFGVSRWASRAICDREWKTRRSRIPGFFLPANPFQIGQ